MVVDLVDFLEEGSRLGQAKTTAPWAMNGAVLTVNLALGHNERSEMGASGKRISYEVESSWEVDEEPVTMW